MFMLILVYFTHIYSTTNQRHQHHVCSGC